MMLSDEQQQVKIAWLYYMEGLTQAEIASRVGTTRLRVNRLLAEARESGLVGITINARLASCMAVEQALREECRLADAVIVPTPENPALVPVLLGRAAGDYLSRYLEQNKVTGLGIGWGATLRSTIRYVRPGHYPGLSVNSMMGGLTRGQELNTFEIASGLAQRLSAQCDYLAAPIYAGSPESRDTILDQDVFKEAFQRTASNQVAILSVGDLTPGSLLIRYGLPSDVSPQDLAAHDAVGDIIGQFLDGDGRPINHPLNRRVLALPLEALGKIPTVIVASGGLNKTAIIAAVLRASLANVLICDEQAAVAALTLVRG